VSEKEEFSKLTSIKKCPVCGEELVKGFIIPTWHLHWDTKKRRFATHLGIPLVWRVRNVAALRCKSCKIVIFDWEEYVSSATPKSFLKKCVGCGKEIPIAELQCQYCGAKQN